MVGGRVYVSRGRSPHPSFLASRHSNPIQPIPLQPSLPNLPHTLKPFYSLTIPPPFLLQVQSNKSNPAHVLPPSLPPSLPPFPPSLPPHPLMSCGVWDSLW